MPTWINNGQETTIGSGGPTWVNNAPVYQQPVQYAQPDYNAMFQHRQPTLVAPEYAQQYIEQPARQNYGYQPAAASFDYGQSGRSGNGMISTRDNAAIMEQLMNAQYQEALRNRNNSMPGMGDWQIQNIKNEADRWAGIRATGQGTSFFSMPQFATPYDMYNEVARLDTSRSSDLDGIMRGVLGNDYQSRVGYNDGRRWSGLQPLTPAGTSFGGGVNMDAGGGYNLPAGLREASFSTSNGQPIISTGPGGIITQYAPNDLGGWSAIGNLNGANATPYNNGDLRSAHDYGSYNSPLLRSGITDGYAIASNHPRSFSGSGEQDFTPFPPASRDANGRSDWMEGPAMPGDGSRNWTRMSDGSYASWGASGELTIQRPDGSREVIDSTPLPESNKPFPFDMSGSSPKFGGATDQFAFPLLNDLVDLQLPPAVEAMLGNAGRGFEIIDNANPANLLPKNAMLNALKDAAVNFATNRNTWRGDGAHFSTIQNILSQPWGNRSAAPMMYPSMAALFL